MALSGYYAGVWGTTVVSQASAYTLSTSASACCRHATDGPARYQRGGEAAEHQGETPWQSLVDRLAEVVQAVRAWAARAAASPARSI